MDDGWFLSKTYVRQLPPAEQAVVARIVARMIFGSETVPEIESAFAPASAIVTWPDAPSSKATTDSSVEPTVQFDVRQTRELITGCGEKTRRVIRAMVSGSSREFSLAAVAAAVGEQANGLGGVLAGLTRRTRSLAKDPKAQFVVWDDSSGEWRGMLSERTYSSVRQVFAIT